MGSSTGIATNIVSYRIIDPYTDILII